jgi:hypothetical protein
MKLTNTLALVLALAGCSHAAEPATTTTTSGDETTTTTTTTTTESSIGHVTFEAVTADGPQVSIPELEAFLASPEAIAATASCVDRFGEMFQSGAGVMSFQVSNEGSAGRMEAPPLDTFGGALAGCVFSEVIEPHPFTPWSPPSGVQVAIRVRFARSN